MSDLRIPPSVDFDFEKVVNEVIELIRPDYERIPLLRTELVEHLRDCWREGIEQNNLSTESAKIAALENFGVSELVAKSFREPYWRRLLFYKRCKLWRYLWIVAGQLFAGYLQGFNLLIDEELHGFIGDQEALTVWIIGSFLSPLIALGIVSFLSWRWVPRQPFLRFLWWVPKGIGWIYFAWFAGTMLIAPSNYTLYLIAENDARFPLAFVLPFGFMGITSGIIGAVCAFAEVLNWPEKRSNSSRRNS